MFQAIYDSPWLNPGAFCAASLGFLAWWLRRKPFLTAFVVLFVVEILADALFNGGWAPPPLVGSRAAAAIAVVFVILGDFRYFLLVERLARDPAAKPYHRTRFQAWGAAAGLSLIVPAASWIANRALPARLTDPRWTYLIYEVMFVALALALRFVWLPRRLAADRAVRAWIHRLTHFEIAQYVLWALADVWILAGGDTGFALRIIPNAMYYAVFLPLVATTAPAELGST